jgi:SAM-dependent methyltransferase
VPKPMPTDRPTDRVRFHYEVEKELATRLREASAAERTRLYTEVYDELFRRVPDHPQLLRKQDSGTTQARVHLSLAILGPFLRPGMTFLEVGPGDCAISLAVAKTARHCYAVDVSTEVTRHASWPANVELVICDGSSVPVPAGSVDLAFSSQLMEHLHPDDASVQLADIHKALRPGGRYVCITPSRLSGPHDVSCHFDAVATGFHLREYTVGELSALFRRAGFKDVRPFVLVRRRFRYVPMAGALALEWLLRNLPSGIAEYLGQRRIISQALGVNIVGVA